MYDLSSYCFESKIKNLQFVEKDKVEESGFSLEELRADVESSGIYVRTQRYEVPLSKEALKETLQCMEVSGNALKRLKLQDLRMVMNKCAKVNPRWVQFTVKDYMAVHCQKENKKGE